MPVPGVYSGGVLLSDAGSRPGVVADHRGDILGPHLGVHTFGRRDRRRVAAQKFVATKPDPAPEYIRAELTSGGKHEN
ncbi:hypothetical protein LAUMK4_04468 [Mycobacterium persicum]|uniref:Uncharacterized protein n=1 Tax=Mycobacterium persicum TaxID=1487726 RepID=A0AB38UYL2_9MYCO|nr:hypothetical protein A4G31_08995 [Mycobacterium persicum]VAZ79466.1 hypothetical protein LAUMK15_04879 [Mycobacterium persicum]VAZ85707.1 hypothetical protein LAUMK42_04545 [Mycobacterium persicum]VAZ99110.1 hypothetical protein LAUMK4_04468 [Mycobacterium persicum]